MVQVSANKRKYKLLHDDVDLKTLEPYISLLGEDEGLHSFHNDEPDIYGALYGGKQYSTNRGKSISVDYYNRLVELLKTGDVDYVSE